MKATKTNKRTVLLTLAQLVCAAVLLLTLIPALLPTVMLISLMQISAQVSQGIEMNSILLCLRDLALGICLVCAEMEALGVLTRMKKASAISGKNEASLGRATRALGIACAITLLFGTASSPSC